VAERWTAVSVPPAAAALRAAGFASPLAELLAQRGAAGPEAARRFLAPSRAQLSPALMIEGLAAAGERLAAVSAQRERILVVGDYDVDGVAATAVMATTLTRLGAEVHTLLPRRDGEGYGLQPPHVRHAAAAGAGLLVAVDSGTTAYAAWEEARRLGIELVIVDHHLAADAPTEEGSGPAPLLVNPRSGAAPAAARELTAAGLTARLAAVLFEGAGRDVPWDSLLRMACLGTIADVAPLVDDNRILAAAGLAALPATPSPGLQALMRAAAVRPPLAAADVAFRLAPRLNAAGRLGAADEALEILLTRDERRAAELAAHLERRNGERQAIEARILGDARRALERRAELPPVVVLSSPEWHAGVVGVAAARLARELNRPTLLLAERDGLATGSGRSVAGLALHQLVAPFAARLERFGGHAQAVGLTIRLDHLPEVRADLEAAAAAWSERLAVREVSYDLELPLAAVTQELVAALAALGPFGAGNPEPVFRFGPCVLRDDPRRFGNGHVRLELGDAGGRGEGRRAIWWRGGDGAERLRERRLELLAAVETDRFDGVRLRLLAVRGVDPASD
jgi:single-stranded-DNA-specific exonuclease